jgi:hypothetical protein
MVYANNVIFTKEPRIMAKIVVVINVLRMKNSWKMEPVLHVVAGSKAKIKIVFLEIVKVMNISLLQESVKNALITKQKQVMEDPAT